MNRTGFTLLEVLAALLIASLLTAVVTSSLSRRQSSLPLILMTTGKA